MCRKASHLPLHECISHIAFIDWFVFTPYWFFVSDKKGEKNLMILVYFNPFVDDWQKGGEEFEIYMHVFLTLLLKGRSIYVYAYMFCFANRRKRIWCVLCLLAFLSSHICIHVYELSLHILLFIYYAWVKGELLWSFTLIHAYITSWVLSSTKKGRLLAQRPITLVLMMINSCSYYCTNDLVFN